jgi:hypothetical protein
MWFSMENFEYGLLRTKKRQREKASIEMLEQL